MDLAGLRVWLTERVGGYLEIPASDLRPDVPLATYGLDSMYMLMLCGDIEDTLGLPMQAATAWEYPTIDALAGYVVERQAAEGGAGEG
jgi:acyl carrier protein